MITMELYIKNFSFLDGILASSGILEGKSERYNTNETFFEMPRTGGDLVAKVLAEGRKVDRALLYGLASMLAIFTLDFIKQNSLAVLSSEAIDIYSVVNWLFNCINLIEDAYEDA